jgi:hypothetical protein
MMQSLKTMAQITQSEVSRETGPWQPLHNSTFRNLLASNLISDIGTFMQSVGAAWLMTSLTRSPARGDPLHGQPRGLSHSGRAGS